MNVKFLRKKYPKFIYQKYNWQIADKNLKISFDFKIEPNIIFNPRIVIKNINKSHLKKVGKKTLDNLIFHLGLIELLSYWKATCSPEIKIEAGSLNKAEINWWKDLIINGMGQFFYENKIDWRNLGFLKIVSKKKRKKSQEVFRRKLKNRILMPISGGKDSIVSLEILKKLKFPIKCFSLNPIKSAKKVMKIAGCRNPIIVKRKIDPKLLELNRQGFLNGHTPFSAYLAFLSILVAIIFDQKYIAFSNERSSNEGNLRYLGKEINHQYSKSFDFEKKFRKYSKEYLAKNIEYFSFLRPLYEIQIAKLFSRYPKYFGAFISCNEAYKTNSGTKKQIGKWCGKCPKCLFVFADLYSFIDKQKLIKIFGQNLFEKKELVPLMKELIGEKKFKPFECVGTKKETLAAFYFALRSSVSRQKQRRGKNQVSRPPFLLKYFEKNLLPKYSNLEKESKKMMKLWNKQHNLSKDFKKILRESVTF